MFDLLKKLIEDLIKNFLGETIADDTLAGFSAVDTILESFPETAFHAERMLGSVLNTRMVESLYNTVLLFGIALIVLKFLKKGFETYTLWTDGDPDADPVTLLTNFFKALAVSLSFLVLYDWIVNASLELIELLQRVINSSNANDFIQLISNGLYGSGFSTTIFMIILLVYGVMLYFQFMKRGIEMVVLRIGMPIACLGLLDSDRGVFKPYMQKFFQNALTVTVQIILGKIGLSVSLDGHYFWAFAIMSVALSTPKFLQEFMIASGGGGGMGNIYHITSLARGASSTVKGLFKNVTKVVK